MATVLDMDSRGFEGISKAVVCMKAILDFETPS